MEYSKTHLRDTTDAKFQVQHHLRTATVAVILGLAISLIFLHNASVQIYGVSEFGVHLTTVLSLGTGLFVASYSIWGVAEDLQRETQRSTLKRAFQGMSIFLVLIVLTPFSINTFFNWTHMIVGTLLFLDQLAISIYLVNVNDYKNKLVIYFVVEIMGGILAALSLPNHMLTYMFQGEVLFQVGFISILFATLPKLTPKEYAFSDSSSDRLGSLLSYHETLRCSHDRQTADNASEKNTVTIRLHASDSTTAKTQLKRLKHGEIPFLVSLERTLHSFCKIRTLRTAWLTPKRQVERAARRFLTPLSDQFFVDACHLHRSHPKSYLQLKEQVPRQASELQETGHLRCCVGVPDEHSTH